MVNFVRKKWMALVAAAAVVAVALWATAPVIYHIVVPEHGSKAKAETGSYIGPLKLEKIELRYADYWVYAEGYVKGRVRSANGSYVPNVEVKVKLRWSPIIVQETFTALTDDNGVFECKQTIVPGCWGLYRIEWVKVWVPNPPEGCAPITEDQAATWLP